MWNGYFGQGKFTRFDSINSNSEIDYVFSLNFDPVVQQECSFNVDDEVVELGFSDHAMVNFGIKIDNFEVETVESRPKPKIIPFRQASLLEGYETELDLIWGRALERVQNLFALDELNN